MAAIRNFLTHGFISTIQNSPENPITRDICDENRKTEVKRRCNPTSRRNIYTLRLFALFLAIIPSSVFAWSPPIGIPAPSWPTGGIDVARPALPSPWTSEKAGFYYIDPTGCSDTSRTYGRPGASRCSLPSSPPAGSIIVLNGTITGSKTISYTGTSGSPIWIMGYNTSSKPTLSADWGFSGSYIIADSLAWNYNSRDGVEIGGNHIMIRNSSLANPFDDSNGSGFGTSGSYTLLYNDVVSQMGNWQYAGSGDIDRHGVKVEEGTEDLWIVDSQFYHIHGDGIQIGDQNNTADQIKRIYIGRNIAYENYQSGFWTKNATDVIFSQNVIHTMLQSSDNNVGPGLGGQYDPKYVWFISNTIRDSLAGIHIVGSSSGGGGPWYVIGNLMYNIEFPGGACNNYDMGAIGYRNEGGLTAIYNTVYNADMFVAIPDGAGGTLRITNNIFSVKDNSSNNCTALDVNPTKVDDYNLVSDASWVNETHEKSEAAASTFTTPGSNFALKSSSLAVGNANPTEEAAFAVFQSRYGIDIRKDIVGTTRPQTTKWDIGAYEFSGQAPTTLPSPSFIKIVPK
jgi:hypothetical protein